MGKFIILLLMFVVLTTNLRSQDNFKSWEAKFKFGNSLVWGDAVSTNNVFNRFVSNESRLAFGLDLQRNLSSIFGLYGSFNIGSFYGERSPSQWTGSGLHPAITANGNYLDYHLGINIDFTSIFIKSNHLLSVYGSVGFGLTNYKAKSFTDGVLYYQVKDKVPIVPWGFGISFRLTDNFSFLFENSFRHMFVDDFDAYDGSGTNVNDIYSLTSIGIKYNFNSNLKRDPQPIIEEEKLEPLIAEEKVLVKLESSLPDTLYSDSIYDVKVIIIVDSIQGPLEYNLTVFEGFLIEDYSVNNATNHQLRENSLKIEWDSVPSDNIAIAYSFRVNGKDTLFLDNQKNSVIKSSFAYKYDEEYKMNFFNKRVKVLCSVEKQDIVLSKNTLEDTLDNVLETQIQSQLNNSIYVDLLEIKYMVQIATISNNSSSPEEIKKYFDLDEEVYEVKYKDSYRYMVGKYNTYGEALQNPALQKIKGSYVVVVVQGKYYLYIYEINDFIKDKDGKFEDQRTYKIQIAASKGRPYAIAKLAYKYDLNIYDISETHEYGWYQYSVGKFKSRKEAEKLLLRLKRINEQVYMVTFD